MHYNLASLCVLVSLVTLTLLSGLLLSSIHTFADDATVDQIALTPQIACTMSGVNTHHTATLTPGTYSGASGSEYENGIGKTTVTVTCNDNNGFAVYATGFSGNEYGATNLVGENTNQVIGTKAYQSGDTISSWSMKLTKITDATDSYNPANLTIATGYDSWHAVPAEYTKVAEYHANTGPSTTDTTLGVKLETTYAVFIATNQPADNYVGQVRYTMIHPYNAIKPANVTCNPNASSISEAVCMQDFAGPNGDQIASTMNLEQQYTLRDKRDGKTYTVAKFQLSNNYYRGRIAAYYESCSHQCQTELYDSLPDEWKRYADACALSKSTCNEVEPQPEESVWMTQNLDLDLDSSVVYTSEDTDIGYNYASNQYEMTIWTPSTSTLTADNKTSWVASDTAPYSYDPGDYYINNVSEKTYKWYTEMEKAGAYMRTCLQEGCDESLYGQLSNEWQTFINTCDMHERRCDYLSMPPNPNPFEQQLMIAKAYASTCVSSGTCDESLYAQLDSNFKTFLNSCDASFETCDQSLRPSESDYISDASMINYGDTNLHLGNYYNWTAAIAMNSSNQYGADNVALVEQSICPSGWTLPRLYETNDSFASLWWEYGFDDSSINAEHKHLASSPIFFIPSGLFDGELNEVGSSGNYWSSMTSEDKDNQMLSGYASYSYASSANPWNKTHRSYGLPVRCIARPVGHFEHVIIVQHYEHQM